MNNGLTADERVAVVDIAFDGLLLVVTEKAWVLFASSKQVTRDGNFILLCGNI